MRYHASMDTNSYVSSFSWADKDDIYFLSLRKNFSISLSYSFWNFLHNIFSFSPTVLFVYVRILSIKLSQFANHILLIKYRLYGAFLERSFLTFLISRYSSSALSKYSKSINSLAFSFISIIFWLSASSSAFSKMADISGPFYILSFPATGSSSCCSTKYLIWISWLHPKRS